MGTCCSTSHDEIIKYAKKYYFEKTTDNGWSFHYEQGCFEKKHETIDGKDLTYQGNWNSDKLDRKNGYHIKKDKHDLLVVEIQNGHPVKCGGNDIVKYKYKKTLKYKNTNYSVYSMCFQRRGYSIVYNIYLFEQILYVYTKKYYD